MTDIRRTSPSRGPGSPDVTGFYDTDTGSCQYVCADPKTGAAALIDVVRGFDPKSAETNQDQADRILDFVADKNLQVALILDTHPHADHFMASHYLKDKTGAPNGIGARVGVVADIWRDLYNLPDAFDPRTDFDRLFEDGDTFAIGNLQGRAMLTTGHTAATVSYVIGDAVFANDTFMQPDVGTSRCDFPGGSSSELYDSLMAILSLPDETRIFVGHDYGTDKRDEPAWESTVAEQRASNAHIGGGTSREDYMRLRDKRDATLALPDRMLAALQVNLRAGQLPPAEADGHSYLKIPLNRFGSGS